MLALSQIELATRSKISIGTMKRIEGGVGTAMPNNLAAVRTALESAGIIFVEENGHGPGVRLRKG